MAPAESSPRSPVYLSYIYNTPSPASIQANQYRPPPPRAGPGHEASPKQRAGEFRDSPVVTVGDKAKPYHPSTHLTQHQLDLEATKTVYHNFHAPWNQHNRFLVAAPPKAKDGYRTLERMPPPPFGNPGRRPSSAPPSRTSHSISPIVASLTPAERQRLDAAVQQLMVGGLANSLVTATGAPSFTAPAVVKADPEEGRLVLDDQAPHDPWRSSRVEVYVVPPHPMGFGPGGSKPFTQDYRHYKYYGFGGKGAKTSWAHNPKESIISAYTYAGFKGYKKTPPEDLPPSYLRTTEMLEPRIETVDVLSCKPVPAIAPEEAGQQREAPAFSRTINKARAMTYRQPATWQYTMTEKYSPHSGSQSPFHQRYTHYKYYGFGGKGATSSWARNPKYAII